VQTESKTLVKMSGEATHASFSMHISKSKLARPSAMVDSFVGRFCKLTNLRVSGTSS